jgi:hypothetical protein
VILWPPSGPVSGVCKADQVADKIIEANRAKAAAKGLELTSENRKKIAAFLQTMHRPLVKAKPCAELEPEEVAPAPAPAPAALPLPLPLPK